MDKVETHKQHITLRFDRQTLQKARVLAAKRHTFISRLLAEQIDTLVGDDAYERAHRGAVSLFNRGLHLGVTIRATRDQWHER